MFRKFVTTYKIFPGRKSPVRQKRDFEKWGRRSNTKSSAFDSFDNFYIYIRVTDTFSIVIGLKPNCIIRSLIWIKFENTQKNKQLIPFAITANFYRQ